MKTLSDVRAANKAAGYFWFERKTMRFFNSVIESALYGGRYFITSERRELTMPKRYSIREAKPNGDVVTIGEFQEFPTIEDARTRVRQILQTNADAKRLRGESRG